MPNYLFGDAVTYHEPTFSQEASAMTTTTPSRIPLEELVRLPSFYLPRVNWAQDRVAYYADLTGRLELYVRDLPDGQPRQLSHGEVPRALRAGFAWNRAGTALVFAKDVDGNEQHDLYRIAVSDGSVTRITDRPGCQEYPLEFSPDDGWLLVASNREGQLNLWRMRPDGSEDVRLTTYPNPVGSGAWSPDGEWIAYTVNESPDLRNMDGYVMRADGSGQRRVFRMSEGTREMVTEWSPDGRLLAVTSDASGVNRSGLLDVQSGDVRWLGEEGVNETPTAFSRDGRWLVCHRNKDSEMRPVLYEVATGTPRELELPAGMATGSDFALGDEALVLSYATEDRRPALLLYGLSDDSVDTLLPAEHGSIDPSVFVTGEHVWYPSSDGREVPALLYRPSDHPPDARLPAIIRVHGGPTAQWFRNFDPFRQFLVSRGYVVLDPNVRGSTGYGREFRELNRHDWGGGDLEDVAAGARYLSALPYVDPGRIAITGGSYGGFMTFLATVKKPELWKAGVAAVGISHLRALYDSSMEHFKYTLRSHMGDPGENAELWADRSAANFAASLQAKLLILHGANDPRCPIEQAHIFRDRLVESGKTLGEDFEYVEFSDEGHGSTDIDQHLRHYRLMADSSIACFDPACRDR